MIADAWRKVNVPQGCGQTTSHKTGMEKAPPPVSKAAPVACWERGRLLALAAVVLRNAAARLVDAQLAAHHIAAVELGDGDLGLVAVRHLDEAEPLGLAVRAMSDDAGRLHDAVAGELLAELIVVHVVVEVADIDLDGLAVVLRGGRRGQGIRGSAPEKRDNDGRDDDDALLHIARTCEGDARHALTALEIAVLSTAPDADGTRRITRAIAEESVQKKQIAYDRDEEGHYNTISAFIKSIRGSDPHAAVYWLAKMLEAGEDPRFIARRLVISASEDIGNADPRGISVAVAAMQAVEFIGMPEARITLAQATTYLATAPKSNRAYMALEEAASDLRKGRVLEVPEHLRNVHVRAVGKDKAPDYIYPHDFAGNFAVQDYLPTSNVYYRPTHNGYEDMIAKRMAYWAAQRGDGSAPRKDG